MGKSTAIDIRDVPQAVGTARRIDQLGRVVVPAELRKMMGLHTGELVDFRFVDGHIELLRVERGCILCGATQILTSVGDKEVCTACVERIRNQPECAMCGRLDDLRERNGKHICERCMHDMSVV
jgi:transcriptional pleiotropic regulator of transition state genes